MSMEERLMSVETTLDMLKPTIEKLGNSVDKLDNSITDIKLMVAANSQKISSLEASNTKTGDRSFKVFTIIFGSILSLCQIWLMAHK
jgi:archaellum component FlaC